jgi:RNA polymerase sigma factor (TIGR02999 family)
MSDAHDITRLLDRAGSGDAAAWDRLVQLVYPDLKRLARGSLSGRGAHTLNTTALVHECYLRLSQASGAPRDRGHLMSLAVRIMRQVLIDHARERLAVKRGGGAVAVPIEDAQLADARQFETLVEIDDALNQLAKLEPRQAQVFECRYFGGLNDDETALALGISPRTVHRDWDAGREWLAARLESAG